MVPGLTSGTLNAVRSIARLTGGVLAALAALHVAWGLGLSFPFRNRRELADAVVGSSAVPPAPACFAVAGALTTGALLTVDGIPVAPYLRRPALLGMAAILGLRGGLGLTGKTTLISPDSHSEKFVRWDKQIYGPLCLGLAVGSLVARTKSPGRGSGVRVGE